MTSLTRAVLYYTLYNRLGDKYTEELQRDLDLIKYHKENYRTLIPPTGDLITSHYRLLNKKL